MSYFERMKTNKTASASQYSCKCTLAIIALACVLVLLTGCSMPAQDSSDAEESSSDSADVYFPTIVEEPTVEEPNSKKFNCRRSTQES